MAAQGGDRAGAAQQGTGGGAVMRPQRRRQLEQWLGPYLSDSGGSPRQIGEVETQGSK